MSGVEPVAVVGMAGRFPGASSPADLWRVIVDGRVVLSRFTTDVPDHVPVRGVLADVDRFDAEFFGMAPMEAAITDPQHRLMLEICWEALETAGYPPGPELGHAAVFAGAGLNYHLLRDVLGRPQLIDRLGLLPVVLANEKDHLAMKVAYRLGLRGPAVTVQTACSTSLVAVHLARRSVQVGDADLALAGGVNITVPQESGYRFTPDGILSPDGHCRAYDAAAGGTVPGNGAAVVVLKRLADAIRDGDEVYAVIRGSAVNNDGAAKAGYTAPGVDGQVDVITRAYADADVDPATVSYVEGHGTATQMGDAIEIAALAEGFQASGSTPAGRCSLGSLKANIGHLDAAAGVAGLIKAVLAVRSATIPPLADLDRPNPAIADGTTPFVLDRHPRPWPDSPTPRRAAVSSFGLGGTNAHVVVEEAPARPATGRTGGPALLVLSARTPVALAAAEERLLEHLAGGEVADLHDVARTLQTGRRAFAHRRAAVCAELADLAGELRRRPARAAVDRPTQAWLFPGQGVRFGGTARELHECHPVFRDVLDQGMDLARRDFGTDLEDLLLGSGDPDPQPGTEAVQPALFLLEVALGRLLQSWGLQPSVLVGHSLGELAAACLADEFDLPDGVRLTAARGRAVAATPPGAMLVAFASAADLDPVLRRLEVQIAARNAAGVVVLGGPPQAVEQARVELGALGIRCQALGTDRAFHTGLVAGAAGEFAAVAGTVAFRPRTVAVLSSVTGTMLPRGQSRDAGYWVRQLRQPVRFDLAAELLLTQQALVALEVGPGTTLCGLLRQAGPGALVRGVLPRSGRSAAAGLLDAVGAAWTAGVPVDWVAMAGGAPARKVALPTYPFQRRAHRLDHEEGVAEPAGPATHPAGNDRTDPMSVVIEAWRDLLGVDAIDAESDFFGLGGESLLLVRLASRLSETCGARIPARKLMTDPTVRGVTGVVVAAMAANGRG